MNIKNFTTISANKFLKAQLSETEKKAVIDKEKAAYKKLLRDLCPSKEMRRQARRTSRMDDTCEKCAYCDDETWLCNYPYSDGYIEDLNIDPCYEGVLRYLAKESGKAEKKREAEAKKQDMMYAEMDETLEKSVDIVLNCLKLICDLSSWIVTMTNENQELPCAAVEFVFETLDWLNEVFPPENE